MCSGLAHGWFRVDVCARGRELMPNIVFCYIHGLCVMVPAQVRFVGNYDHRPRNPELGRQWLSQPGARNCEQRKMQDLHRGGLKRAHKVTRTEKMGGAAGHLQMRYLWSDLMFLQSLVLFCKSLFRATVESLSGISGTCPATPRI